MRTRYASFLKLLLLAPAVTGFVNLAHQKTKPIVSQHAVTGTDCGCGEVKLSGEPTERVQNGLDIREELRSKALYRIDGSSLTIDDILGEPTKPNTDPSIVVFFRSLG